MPESITTRLARLESAIGSRPCPRCGERDIPIGGNIVFAPIDLDAPPPSSPAPPVRCPDCGRMPFAAKFHPMTFDGHDRGHDEHR